MRVLDIITESKKSKSEQLDELSLSQVGRGVGKVARGAAKATGAVAGGLVGAGKAFMKGFRGAKAFVGGDEEPTKKKTSSADAPAGTTTTAAPAQTTAPTASAAPSAAPSAPTTPAAAAKPAAKAQASGKTDMKTIKTAIQALPKNQRASLRKIIAAKAGVA